MAKFRKMAHVQTIAELEALYPDAPVAASTVKVTDRITPDYARLIAASRFVALATATADGLDVSPRGDDGPVVRIESERRLLLPDWRGNNRLDSLRNIVADPRVALLFLIAGSGTTLRVNGLAHVSAEPGLLERFETKGRRPRTVVVIEPREVYFQCARAVVRSGLWDSASHVDPKSLPTPGAILANLTAGEVGGRAYDEEWPERAAKTLW